MCLARGADQRGKKASPSPGAVRRAAITGWGTPREPHPHSGTLFSLEKEGNPTRTATRANLSTWSPEKYKPASHERTNTVRFHLPEWKFIGTGSRMGGPGGSEEKKWGVRV